MLKVLDLSGSRQVTNGGAKQVVEGCTQLKMLDLRKCEKLTEDGVVSLVDEENRKDLNVLFLRRGMNSQTVNITSRNRGNPCMVVTAKKCCQKFKVFRKE